MIMEKISPSLRIVRNKAVDVGEDRRPTINGDVAMMNLSVCFSA